MVWSLARAWEYHKPIVAIIAAYSLITAAYQIADLFFAPQILARLEERAPVGKLLLTILVFTLFEGVSLGLMRYMHEMQNIRFRVVNRRLHEKVIEKQCCTSYSNMLLSKTVHLRETSENTVNNNRWGPSEIYLMLATMGSTLFSFLSALSLMTYLSLPIALISLIKMMSPDPIPGMYDYIVDLKRRGYKVCGLSNWSAETFCQVRHVYPVFDLLDGMVVSGYEGVVKPDARIYQLLLGRYGLKASECVFIDDNAANVEGARRMGMQSLRFTTKEALEGPLESLLAEN